MRALRQAIRHLYHQRGFSAAAVLTLALGIGCTAAVFSIVNSLLFAPLEVHEPSRLLVIYSGEPGDFLYSSPLASVDAEVLRRESRTLADIAAYTYSPLALEHGEESRLVLAGRATPGFFSLLGVETALGRTFRASGGEQAILAYATWKRHFASDPGIVGRSLRLDGRPIQVVGVAPESFLGVSRGVTPEVWLSLDEPLSRQDSLAEREHRWLWVIARLHPGLSPSLAIEEVEAFSTRLAERFPETHAARRFTALPMKAVRILPGLDGQLQKVSGVLMLMVSMVLLIACANVAHLLLVRALDRRREVATHLALGAGALSIIGRLLLECFVLASLGGLGGLGIAVLSNRALGALDLPLPVDLDLGVDLRVLVFAAAAVMLATLLFGLAPALEAARTDIVSALRGAQANARSRRFARVLVVAQVALSLLLVAVASLMLRSLEGARELDAGFKPENVAVATFAAPRDPTFDGRLLDRVRALPEVMAAGLSSHLPLTLEIRFSRVGAAGEESPPRSWPEVDSAWVSEGYFEAMGIPLIGGRDFAEQESEVVVVNQAFSAHFWPQGGAIGRRLRLGDEGASHRVIAVVGDGAYRTLGDQNRPFLYRPLGDGPRSGLSGEITTGSLTLVTRTRTAPEDFLPTIRSELRALEPGLALARLEPLERTLSLALFLPRSGAWLFGLFALVGLSLASVGLGGILHYAVRRRRHEIGIRMALGADRRQVSRLVWHEALHLTLSGMVAGFALVLLTTRSLEAFLYGVDPADPLSLFIAAAILFGVALGASWLPVRRAVSVDPASCLRSDG